MKGKTLYTSLGLGVLLTAGITSSCGRDQERPAVPQTPAVQPTVPNTQPSVREYTVQRGDIPSVWVYNSLGLRGNNIYKKVKEIGALSGVGPERDIVMKVDGELVSGKDGYFDS